MTVSGGSGTRTFVKTSSFMQSGITLDTSAHPLESQCLGWLLQVL
jgi:hypothetical protein